MIPWSGPGALLGSMGQATWRLGRLIRRVSLPILLVCSTARALADPDPAAVRKMWSPFVEPLAAKPEEREPRSELVSLGRHLFFERALSPDRARSCNDCHDLSRYGTNGDAVEDLRKAGKLRRDVPSLYNLGGLKLFGWDARKKDLRSYTAAALTSPEESALRDPAVVVERLEATPAYRERFAAAFEGGRRITFDRVVAALTAFQEGLVTPAPFDAFLAGDDQALTAEQLKGAVIFDQKNCSACHTGSAIGGQMIQIAGIMKPWPNQDDLGHFEVTKKPAHKLAFRVPPLRNVAKTGPYFHDHSARSLRRAIRDIAFLEQGMNLDLDEIIAIEAFLESFTGKLPEEYIQAPGGAVRPPGDR